MTKRKGIRRRRAHHRVAPSHYTDQLNGSDSQPTQRETEIQAPSSSSSSSSSSETATLLQQDSGNDLAANSTPNRTHEADVPIWFSSPCKKNPNTSLTLDSNFFNAELNIRPKGNETVAVYAVQTVPVPNKPSSNLNALQAGKNKSVSKKPETSMFTNPSEADQDLEKKHFHDLREAADTPHANKCLACLNKCCRVRPEKKRRSAPVSDYVVKLDPELKDRMTLMLETTRDHYHSLEATLKAAVASKNKSLIKNMAVKAQVHDVFMHYETAVYLLHRVHFFCGDAIRTLSYYFETDMTTEKLNKVQGRSVLGSYMWLITLCMQAVHGGVDKDVEEFDEIKRTLEDIVGQSFVIWRGITHVVGAFIDCRQTTESILRKYLEPWDPEKGFTMYRQAHVDEIQKLTHKERSKHLSEQEQVYIKKDKELQKLRKTRLRQLKLHNKVGDNEVIRIQIDADSPLPSPPEVKIVRCRLGDNIWVQYKDIRNVDRLLTLNQLSKKVVQILDEVHGYLQGMDKFIHLFSNSGEINEPDMSYLQAITRLNKHGKRLAKIAPSKLSQQDLDALAILSRSLIDEMDLTEFLVMTLRSLIHETRHAIHVSYEYTRLFYPRSLLQYEFISPPDHAATCLERLHLQTVFEDYEFDKIDFKSAVTQFNTSPYIDILKLFPVKEVRHLLMLKPF